MSDTGVINFTALKGYLWEAEDMGRMQDYLFNYMNNYISTQFEYGVLEGCEISLSAGFTLDIAPGILLFPNGRIVPYAGGQVDLSQSDGTQDRYDRISLSYISQDNTTVQNLAGTNVILDKLDVASTVVQDGTLGASAAPAVSASNISLGVVFVENQSVNILESWIDQSYTNRKVAIKKNAAKKQISLLNNVTDQAVSNFLFDSTVLKAFKFNYTVDRSDDSTSGFSFGQLFAWYSPAEAKWLFESELSIDKAGVSISLTDQGQLKYTTTNFTGTGHSCDLKIIDLTPIYV